MSAKIAKAEQVRKLERLLARVQERRSERPVRAPFERVADPGFEAPAHAAGPTHVRGAHGRGAPELGPAEREPGHIAGLGLSGAARSALDRSGLDPRGAAALERSSELERDALVASGLVLGNGEVHDRPTIQLGDDDEGDYEPPPRVERLLPEVRGGEARRPPSSRPAPALELPGEREEQPTLKISRKILADRVAEAPPPVDEEDAVGEQEETTGEHGTSRKTFIFGEEEETTGELSLSALSAPRKASPGKQGSEKQSSEDTIPDRAAPPGSRRRLVAIADDEDEDDDEEVNVPTIAPPASEAANLMGSIPRAPRVPAAPPSEPAAPAAPIEAARAPEPIEPSPMAAPELALGASGASVARAVGAYPRPRPSTFGELIARSLALRPRADRRYGDE